MSKTYCLKLAKKIFIFTTVVLVVSLFGNITNAFALSTDTINLQGKIVRNDTGYEGLNVSTGNPSCVVAGSGNDTCDFRVRYYSATSGGTLFLTEEFSNREIGQFNGAFNLSLGSDPSPTAGSYSSLDALIKAEDTIYVEIGFDPSGANTYTEVFTRMPIQASAFALRAKYASGANTAFQFHTATNSTGYSTPSAGMVYFDTTDTTLKVYDGTSWVDIGGGGTGSLWTDTGTYSYLTDTGDHFVLGSSSYTAIGSSDYGTYVGGLGSRPPFSFDMDAERLTLSGSASRTGLTVYSDYSSSSAWPVVLFKAEDSGFDNLVLEIVQDGTGDLMSMKKGSTEVFAFENAMTFFMRPRDTAPSVSDNRLYNVAGTLYWNGSALSTSSSLWTDGGLFTYLTDPNDDVIIGGTNASNAKFYFDVANGRLGIGTGTPTSTLDIAGASSIISNNTGDITISPNESVVVKAQNTDGHNLMEWQNSSGTVLGSVNSVGNWGVGVTPTSNSRISSRMVVSDPSANVQGFSNVVYVSAASANSALQNVSIASYLYVQGSYNHTNPQIGFLATSYNNGTGNVSYLEGFRGGAGNISSGTVTNMYGGRIWIHSPGSGAITNLYGFESNWYASTVTDNMYGIYVATNTGSAGVSKYGIRVGNVSGASSVNYSIYTGTGENRFGDRLSVNGSSDRTQLIVKGNSTQTTNLQEWQNSSSTVLSLINQSGYASFGKSTGSTVAMLSLGANTTSVAQMNLASSSGVNVASPSTGDIWWNGTSLFFNDGSSSINLLAGAGGTHGSFVSLMQSVAQEDTGTSVSSIWINKTGTGGNLLRFQDTGSDVFVVDKEGGLVMAGDIEVQGGSINLGSTGWVRFNDVTSVLEFTNDSTNWIPLGSPVANILLSAEYAGAVLSADGTNNSGSMIADNEGISSNSMNYYEWNSTETSLNDYDVRIRFRLPSNFSSWGSGGITFNYATEATGTTNNKLDFYIYEESSSSVDGSSEGNSSSSAGVWKTSTVAGSSLTECVSAGDVCMILIKMSSANNNYTRVGDIDISFNRKL